MISRTELKIIDERFCAFTDRYRTAGELHPMQQLKLEHSIRVAADARAIAEKSDWDEDEINLAEAIGLLHDTARFPQFEQYKTFSDANSIDHGDLGFQTLEKENLLAELKDEPRALILHSVQYHNKKDLPRTLTAHEEKHLRLIRDADRMDIFFVCWDALASGSVHDNPALMMGVDFTGPPTESVLDQFDRGEAIDYKHIKTMADRFVLQLSWMHDLSYDASKRLVLERGVLDKFIDVLPVKTDRLLRCFTATETFLAASSAQKS
jgi:hypothetical protein